ncbi:MAG: PQQ-binding-like beta-propeller repeat protein [Candidatus Bathyarchaeia archaeon]
MTKPSQETFTRSLITKPVLRLTMSSWGKILAFMLVASFLTSLVMFQPIHANANSASDDWPMFQHDLSHTGYSTSAAPLTNQSLWSFAAFDSGSMSPASVANGIVYVGGNTNLYAINAANELLLWNYTGAPVNFGFSISAPAVANGIVYAGNGDGDLYAFDALTGSVSWVYKTVSGGIGSPSVANGIVYIGSGDFNVYALNATIGTVIWNYTTGDQVYSSPALVNGTLYISSYDGNVYALNAKDGTVIWKFLAYPSNPKVEVAIPTSPAIADGIVYVGSPNDNVYALNASSGAQLWSYTTGGGVSCPAVANGVVYVGSADGNVYALNAATGALTWIYSCGSPVGSSLAVSNGMVYVCSNLYHFPQNLGSTGTLCGLNAATGKNIWSFSTQEASLSFPVIAGNVLYISSGDGQVYAFGVPSTQTPSPSLTSTPSQTTSPSPSPTPSVPEFPPLTIPILLILMASTGLLVYFKKHKRNN